MIVRNETTIDVDGIGPVAFAALERSAEYWRTHYGRTHQQDFRFTANGRDYWGVTLRGFDKSGTRGNRTTVEAVIYTRGANGHGRTVAHNHKTAWRVALVKQFKIDLEAFVEVEGR